MKKLLTVVLCALMVFGSVVSIAPTTALAKSKCSHKKTKKCTHPKEVVKVVKKATCTEDGKVTYTCKKCGKLLQTSKVKKLGHKWSDWKITSKAKNKMVNIRRSCKRCKKVQKQTCPDVGYWGWY